MTVALPATTPATFEIKSANLPLVALLLKSADLHALARDMSLRFGDIPDFFDQDPLLIDLSLLEVQTRRGASPTGTDIDFSALVSLLGSFQLVPIAVKGGTPAQMAAALLAGLLPAPDAHPVGARAAATAAPDLSQAAMRQPSPPAAPATPAALPGALVIDKPLRSGQQVYARGRDLVVLAMVNPGAEVIADGHIHVYAPLRGKAMAGARGNTDARIFALSLEAELVSIAGVYRTSEHPLPPGMAGHPVQVRLVSGDSADKGDKLVMSLVSG